MKKNVEIELKLLIGKKDLKKLLAAKVLQDVVRQDSEKTLHLCSSYYDTDDLNFKKHGIAYRVRDKGDGSFEATVKTSRKSSSGLSERVELNMPLNSDEAVLTGFKELGLGFELTELAPAGVEKLFTTEIERTTYILDLPGAVAELAIDKGCISRGRDKDKIEEIEIELLEGNKGALLEFAARIAAEVPVFIEKRSKFTRGLALLGIEPDMQNVKCRIAADKNIRAEMLQAVQVHGDRLLECQNRLRAGVERAAVKSLVKELVYLRSYLEFGIIFAEDERAKKAAADIGAYLQKLRELLLVWKVQKLWQQIITGDGLLFEKSVLAERLLELEKEAVDAVRDATAKGVLTSAVFDIISWLHNISWENEEYLQAGSTIRCRLQEWQEALEKQETAAGKYQLAENMTCICKSVQDKELCKTFCKPRKYEAAERVVKAEVLNGLLRRLGHGSNSRVLSRDIGILTGWLLAKNKIAGK